MNVPENNVKDDQSEAKVQNDVMGEKRSTNEMAWKPLETRPHRREWCPRGRGASASHRTSAGMIVSIFTDFSLFRCFPFFHPFCLSSFFYPVHFFSFPFFFSPFCVFICFFIFPFSNFSFYFSLFHLFTFSPFLIFSFFSTWT